jgi:hypothetical protein
MALRTSVGTLTMGTASPTSGTMLLRGATSGHLVMPDALSGTVLTFNTSADGQTYRPLHNAAGLVTPAVSVGGSRSYPLPAELFGAHSFYLTAGTIQADARTFIVALRGGS